MFADVGKLRVDRAEATTTRATAGRIDILMKLCRPFLTRSIDGKQTSEWGLAILVLAAQVLPFDWWHFKHCEQPAFEALEQQCSSAGVDECRHGLAPVHDNSIWHAALSRR